jgi:hypothetical protein
MKKIILVVLLGFTFAACGKKDEPVNTQNQSSTQNVTQNQADINNKWTGVYTFEESAKNVTGDGAQSWNYVITVKPREDKTLVAEIQIDGFQTMTRIEADVKADDKKADFVFAKYMPENMFELYKKGDRLFSMEVNTKNEFVTNWDKMKAFVVDNQKNGLVLFKKMSS